MIPLQNKRNQVCAFVLRENCTSNEMELPIHPATKTPAAI
jgi:hypothetical protein